MNNFFEKNYKLVFQEWISPNELKNNSVLDLGSQTGWLGEYCMANGASEYVGVEIDEFHINDSRQHYPNLTFFHMDLEDYVDLCVKEYKTFDIAVISRTLQGIQNQMTLLQKLSKITKKIVLETGVPTNEPIYKLMTILKNYTLTDDHKEEVEQIKHYIEYDQTFVEFIIDDRWPQPVPSTGILKDIFSRLGFELDLTTYESVKEKYPTEYGYGPGHEVDQLMKRSILKFVKVSDIVQPLTWKEWDDLENK
jgi:ubiquinone/menaquinone biosynthesis C-methylase UbiE